MPLIISPSLEFFDNKTRTNIYRSFARFILFFLSQLDDTISLVFTIYNVCLLKTCDNCVRFFVFCWFVFIVFRSLFLVSVISLTYELIFYAILSYRALSIDLCMHYGSDSIIFTLLSRLEIRNIAKLSTNRTKVEKFLHNKIICSFLMTIQRLCNSIKIMFISIRY